MWWVIRDEERSFTFIKYSKLPVVLIAPITLCFFLNNCDSACYHIAHSAPLYCGTSQSCNALEVTSGDLCEQSADIPLQFSLVHQVADSNAVFFNAKL